MQGMWNLRKKAVPKKRFLKLETKVESVDKSKWKDILVFAEVSGGNLHPVSLELIGKARQLAAPVGVFGKDDCGLATV